GFFTGHHCDDAWKLLRSGYVDVSDPRVSMNAASNSHVQHARQDDVVHIGRSAAHQPWIFLSLHCLANVTLSHADPPNLQRRLLARSSFSETPIERLSQCSDIPYTCTDCRRERRGSLRHLEQRCATAVDAST